jgi:hypothetical protein
MKVIDYSPIHDNIFLSTINGEIEIYEDEQRLIYSGIDGKTINSASFSHNAQHVIFVDEDETELNIIAYDDLLHNNFNYIFNFRTDFIIEDYAVSPNKNQIAILFRLRHHITHFIDRQRFFPDADLNNILLHVYDFTPGNCRLIFRKYVNGIANIAFSELDTIAIIGEFNVEGRNCALNIFDLKNGSLIDSHYEIDNVLLIHFFPESERNHNKLLLITQDADERANAIYAIETRTIDDLQSTQHLFVEFDINSIFIKRDGEIAFGTSDGMRFFQLDGPRPLHRNLFRDKIIGQISYSQSENSIGFGVLEETEFRQMYRNVHVFNITLNRLTFNEEMYSSDEDDELPDDNDDNEYDEHEEILINPPDLNTCVVPPTNPAKLEQYQNQTCFDTIQLNEENIGQYLSADRDNIVIFYKQSADADFFATCLTFMGLRKYLQDPKHAFYRCVHGKDYRTYIDDQPDFLKIPTITQTIFVSYEDIKQKYIQRQNMIFLEYIERVETTITYEAVVTNNFVSSNHCQPGSFIDVFRIIF